MKASIKLKAALASAIHRSGIISRSLKRYSSDDFVVLMYHRVLPKSEVTRAVQPGMIIEPETLDLHIRFLKKYCELTPLSHLISAQAPGGPDSQHKPLCALTFDDGWCDFYQYAYPILKHHGVPATVFLPTDFIGTARWFWTDRLGFLLDGITDSPELPIRSQVSEHPLVTKILVGAKNRETRLENAISILKNHRSEDIEAVLVALIASIGKDLTPRQRAFLSWEEVREMADSGLIAFGSHTAGHPILPTLTEDEVSHEIIKSRDVLISEKVVSPAFISFSYPNGNFTKRLSGMVREAGYHMAVTTQHGWNRCGEDLYTLRRIAIHQDMAATEAMFASRLLNLL